MQPIDSRDRVSAIVVAGGAGVRMKSPTRKQYLRLNGLPVLSHTVRVFDRHPLVNDIVLVAPEGDFDFCRTDILAPIAPRKTCLLVAGGSERQESVRNGLTAVGDSTGTVVIHDGVRPFVSEPLIATCIAHARSTGACILAVTASDTVKQIVPGANSILTLDRKHIRLAQTPQAFRLEIIRAAHDEAAKKKLRGTDDASLVERMGHPVMVVEGSRWNLKITEPEDIAFAEAILRAGLLDDRIAPSCP